MEDTRKTGGHWLGWAREVLAGMVRPAMKEVLRDIERWTGHRRETPIRLAMKTTAAGIVAALVIILGEVSDLIDDSPATAFQMDVVIAQLVVAWGFIQAANKKP